MSDLTATIDEVKSRLAIEAVIGRRVQLRKQGPRYVGLCPFHQEKSPSFTVTPDRGFFKCFGCGKGGDVITFVREIDGLEFMDALRVLADEAGVALPETGRGSGQGVDRDLRQEARAALQRARELFASALRDDSASGARQYLEKRGIDAPLIARFGIGWAPPEPGWLTSRLQKERVRFEAVELAGLGYRADDGRVRDRFWDRIVFPVADHSGRTAGFGARYLPGSRAEEKGMGKYVNSPEGPLFPKRRMLYALEHLAAGLRENPEAPILITEGFLDVILLHKVGATTALAALGTAFTPEHARLLARKNHPMVLLLDGDRAGKEAAFKAARLLIAEGVDCRVADLPQGTDPADLAVAGGKEEIVEIVASAWDIMEWRLRSWRQQSDFGAPASRDRAAREAADWIDACASPALAERWVQVAGDALGVTEGALRRMARQAEPVPEAIGSAPEPSQDLNREQKTAENRRQNERTIVAALLKDPSLITLHESELRPLSLRDEGAEAGLGWALRRWDATEPCDLDAFLLAHGADPLMSWIDEFRNLDFPSPSDVLEKSLRTLPGLVAQEDRYARRRSGQPADDETLRRLANRTE